MNINTSKPGVCMGKMEVKILLEKIALENDKDSFSRLFKLYHTRLIRFALMFVYSMKDAEDVVSEVMIKLLKQREKLTEIDNFEGYLYRAIKNQALNLKKKNSFRQYVVVTEIPQDYLTNNYVQPLEVVLEKDLRTIVTEIIEGLPAKRGMVYKMIKDDNLTIREVSELLDIAEKTVKKHLELAMKDLRKAVESYYIEKKSKTQVIPLPRDVSL